MKEQLLLVFELHEEDQKLLKLQESLDQLTVDIKELEEIVMTQQASFNEKSGQLAELETSKLAQEREVETANMRLKELESKLNQIKTNKEYQAALKEISETKKNNKSIEDRILEQMNQIEQLKTESQEIQKNLETAQENLKKKNEEVSSESARLKEEVEKIEKQKEKIITQLEPRLVAQYQRVQRSRTEALSEVIDGTCQGCRMKIPPQLSIEIQKFKAVHSCPSCQRILYRAEWIKGDKENVAENASA